MDNEPIPFIFDKNKLSKIFPYILPFCIFLGITKILIFYKSFSIDIVYFIGFQEILLTFLDDFLLYVYGILLIIIILLPVGRKMTIYNDQRFDYVKTMNFKMRLKHSLLKSKFETILLILSWVMGIKMFIKEGVILLLIFPLLALIRYVLIESRITYIKDTKKDFDITYFNLASLIIGFIIIIIANTLSDVSYIKKGKYNGTILYFQNETIVADSNNIFIGKSDKFVFLYNSKKKAPVVYDCKNLNKIIYNIR